MKGGKGTDKKSNFRVLQVVKSSDFFTLNIGVKPLGVNPVAHNLNLRREPPENY